MNIQPPVIAPSILAADYQRLGEQVQECVEAGTSWIHCDIMDGHFVPNLSFGSSIVKATEQISDFFVDVHFMIEDPDAYVESFVAAGANLITVHQEVCPHLHRTVQHIKRQDIKAGVAVNPATPLNQIQPILEYVDLVLIMSVNPGFGGQSFINATNQKLKNLRTMREERRLQFLIEVDGGINPENINQIARAGGEVFVVGSSIFKASQDISSRIKKLTQNASTQNDLYI